MSDSPGEHLDGHDGGRRVLFVDDDAFLLEALARRLRGAFPVVIETDALVALERISREGPFAVVVADYAMGPLDGARFLARCKDAAPDTTRVLMTGAKDAEVAAAVLGQVDLFRLLLKPVGDDLLEATLEGAVREHRLSVEQRLHRTRLKREHERYDALLRRMFPADVARQLRDEGGVPPRRLDDVTILFADLVDFTPYCESRPSEQVVEALQRITCAFEDVTLAHGLQKIKTIGDAFMAIALPLPSVTDGIERAVDAGLAMLACPALRDLGFDLRVGLHVGPVTAALIGRAQFAYDVFGDAVNTAFRTTQYARPGGVTLSEEAARRLSPDRPVVSSEPVRMKGKGLRHLFRVEERAPANARPD